MFGNHLSFRLTLLGTTFALMSCGKLGFKLSSQPTDDESASRAITGTFQLNEPFIDSYQRSPVRISWTAAARAARYNFKVSRNSSCSSPILAINDIFTTQTQVSLNDGTYYLCLSSKDAAGQSRMASGSYRRFYVDSTAPGAFSISAMPSLTNTNQPVIRWGVSAGEEGYTLKIDDNMNCQSPERSFLLATEIFSKRITPALPDGRHYVCVSAVDRAGNATLASNSGLGFDVDTQAPSADLAGLPGNPSKSVNLGVTVSGTGVTDYQFAVTNGAACSSASYSVSRAIGVPINDPIGSDGQKILCVKAIDLAGNVQSGAREHSWLKDTVSPRIMLSGKPSNPSNDTALNISVRPLGRADADLFQYKYSFSNSTLPCSDTTYGSVRSKDVPITDSVGIDGPKRICVMGLDPAGNEGFESYYWTNDTQGPGAFSLSAITSPSSNRTPTFSWTAASDVSNYVIGFSSSSNCSTINPSFGPAGTGTSFTVPAGFELSDGSYYVCAYARDLLDNRTYASNNGLQLAVDATPPGAFSITGPVQTPIQSPFVVEWSAASGSSRYGVRLASDSLCSNLVTPVRDVTTMSAQFSAADGIYYACVTAKDSLELTTNASNNGRRIEVDSTPPTAFTIATMDAEISDSTPTINWPDAAGAVNYRLKIDNNQDCLSPERLQNSQNSLEIVRGALPDGAHFICIDAIDRAGNTYTARNFANGEVARFVVDTAAPLAIIGNAPASFSNVLRIDLTLSGTGVVEYRYDLRNASSCSTVASDYSSFRPISQHIAQNLGVDGQKIVCVHGRDAAGNTQSAAAFAIWTKDTQAPVITLDGLPTDPSSSEKLNVMVRDAVSGSSDLFQYKYGVIDGSSCAGVTYSVLKDKTVPITDFTGADGTKTLCVVGNDKAENAYAQTYTWMRNSAVPEPFSIAAQNGVVLNSGSLSLGWSPSVGAISYRIRISTTSTTCQDPIRSEIVTGTSVTLNLADASYYICVDAVNAAQTTRAATNSPLSLRIDTVRPANVTLSQLPADRSNAANLSVLVLSASDAVRYQYAVKSGNDCSGVTYSADQLLAVPIGDAIAGQGNKTLCVKGLDAAGNIQSGISRHSWVQDSVAPSFTITGAPSGPFRDDSINVGVMGTEVNRFRVAVVEGNSSCPLSLSYGPLVPVAQSTEVSTGLDGPKTVCVRARDVAGNEDARSISWVQDTLAPSAFGFVTFTSPTNIRRPTFTWGLADGAASYNVYLDNDADCRSPNYQSPNLSGTTSSWTVPADLPSDGLLRVCLKASDQAGNVRVASNSPMSFVLDTTPPSAFSINSGALFATRNPTIAWQAADGASHYRLKVAADISCANAIFSGETPNTSETVISNLGDGTYYACVSASDTAGNVRMAKSVKSFVVDLTPSGAFELTSVNFTHRPQPSVSWQTSQGAVSYDMLIGAEPTCAGAIQTHVGLTGNQHQLNAISNGRYFACMVARDQAGNTQGATNRLEFNIDLQVAPAGSIVARLYDSAPYKASSITVSSNNLTARGSSSRSSRGNVFGRHNALLGKDSGRWYFEARVDNTGGSIYESAVGISSPALPVTDARPGRDNVGCAYYRDGRVFCGRSNTPVANFAPYKAGDVIGLAFDGNYSRAYFSKNGVWQNSDPAAGQGGLATGTIVIANIGFFPVLHLSGDDQMTANFGSTPVSHVVPVGFARGWYDQLAPAGSLIARYGNTQLFKAANASVAETEYGSRVVTAFNSEEDSVLSLLAVNDGKYYWETRIDRLENTEQFPDREFNGVGATVLSSNRERLIGLRNGSGCGYFSTGGVLCDTRSPAEAPSYLAGDVIGIAMDLATRKMYFSKNSVWINGSNPEAGIGGFDMGGDANSIFYPAVTVSGTDMRTSNFGQRRFFYAVPRGFQSGVYQ